MEITSSPDVNTHMHDRMKVAEYHAILINFHKLVEAIEARIKPKSFSPLTAI